MKKTISTKKKEALSQKVKMLYDKFLSTMKEDIKQVKEPEGPVYFTKERDRLEFELKDLKIREEAENHNFTMVEIISQAFPDQDILIADWFDDAAIGIEESSMRVIYSVSKCIEILEEQMDTHEAVEYFEFNVAGAYVGEKTPVWCYDNF